MEIKYNQIKAHYGEPISLEIEISGTILSEYSSIKLNMKGAGAVSSFSKSYTLEVDDQTLKFNLTEKLDPGRYYYEIVGEYSNGELNTFTDRPLLLEVFPKL